MGDYPHFQTSPKIVGTSKLQIGQFHRCCVGQSEVNFLLKCVSNIEEPFLIAIFGSSIVTQNITFVKKK